MKKILLHSETHGNHFAFVDDEDWLRVSDRRWNTKLHHHKIIGQARWWDKIEKKYETVTLARYIMRAGKGQIVDHINNNSLDNRKDNLRFVTPMQNARNKSKYPRNGKITSQYKGVIRCEYRGKRKHSIYFISQIRIDGRLFHLGVFNNEVDAAKAYDSASLKYHGAYGRCNFQETSR